MRKEQVPILTNNPAHIHMTRISLECHTDPNVIANGTLTVVSYSGEILRAIFGPYTGAPGLDSSWCWLITGLMWPECK